MRVSIAIAALVLIGCSHDSASLGSEYQAAARLLRAEKYGSALEKIEDGIRRTGRAPDSYQLWRFRLLKADLLLAQRRTAEASVILEAGSPQRSDLEAKALLLRGFAAYLGGRTAESERLLAKAADLAQRSGHVDLQTEIELRQGLVRVSEGKLDEAESLFRDEIGRASALHDDYLTAMATGNLGYTLLHESRYDEAIVWFEKAKILHLTLGADESMARDTGNIGWCYYRLGDFDNARAHFEQAVSVFAKTGNRFDQQIWLGNIATVLMDQQNFADAATIYRQALTLARQASNNLQVAQLLSNLAECSIGLGDANQAEIYNNEALALKKNLPASRSQVYSLQHAAKIAAMRNQFANAEELYRKALNEPADDPTVTLDSRAYLADLYIKTGRNSRARSEFQMALAGIDQFSSTLVKEDYRLSYLDSLIRFYRRYIDFLVSEGQTETALEVAESSRSHVLVQRSGRAEVIHPQRVGAYRELARKLRGVLLEYWLGDDRSYLWVISAQHIRTYTVPAAKTIRPLTQTYRNLVLGQRNPLDAGGDNGRKLYDMLLAPAASDLCAGCRVVIIPDQDLYSFNLETLPAGGQSHTFWIENADVTIAPSLNYLVDANRRETKFGKGLLVMGDPDASLAEFPKLEFAAPEINSIRTSMNKEQARVLRGAEARPSAYAGAQPGQFEFIHFSAHATANTQSPLDSAVILSGPPDRCRLFARDVMSVPLTAELVTISACRSAGARTYAGEGLVGFAWAFLRAGARNVIAGLWDVNDRSTEELMSRLYAEIARGSSPADALRAAKLSLIHAGGSYAKPFYWAPFQVYTGAIN